MQKLYSIIFPSVDIVKTDSLYFRESGFTIDHFNHRIIIPQNGTLNTCTYFNAFSLEKWNKYTKLSSLYLKLSVENTCKINVYTKYLVAGDYLNKLLESKTITTLGKSEVIFDLTQYLTLAGLLYFEITSLDEKCFFYSGDFYTNQQFEIPNIGIAICTYKREKYIKKFVFNFEHYDYNSNIIVFISDNGGTLPRELENDQVFIFKNKNYGGVGGFTRGMLEIKKYNLTAPSPIQYILLMDDDILLDFRILERLSCFLALRKEKYWDYFIAGSMCSLDYPHLQYEKMSSWRGDHFLQSGASYDLRDINTIVTNEREDQLINCSAGWWFSCFSEKLLTPNNYPFPCFFRGDDMEFTIRNGSKIITLNGLCVWHEPFYKKYSIISENYYLYRNTLVINTLYQPYFGLKNTIKYLFKGFAISLVKYDYKSAELILRAWKDYCKGVVFFQKTDPEELNTELSHFNYQRQPLQEAVAEYRYDDINNNIYFKKDKNVLQSLIRHITINGFFYSKIILPSLRFCFDGIRS